MDGIYFLAFSLIIAYAIFLSLKYDDQAEFTGQKRNEKFKTEKNTDPAEEDPSQGS